VAAGRNFTIAVTEAGAVYSFGVSDGRFGHGQYDWSVDVFLPRRIKALDGIHVVAVAAGIMHSLALTRCGQVCSWGAIDRGSILHGLGNDSDDESDSDDLEIDCHSIPHLICAVTDSGALYTWGDNEHGNLGHGDVRHRERPTLVKGLQVIRIVAVSIDLRHTLALAADGSVFTFGEGHGLGISQVEATHSPRRIPDLVCKGCRRN
jgi:alpha-tubulin suppressor-like RCC1 family protein